MFGFKIDLYENKTCREIMQLLDEIRKKDHKDNGALIVCTLSHGDSNTVTGACSKDLIIDEMMSLFSNLSRTENSANWYDNIIKLHENMLIMINRFYSLIHTSISYNALYRVNYL